MAKNYGIKVLEAELERLLDEYGVLQEAYDAAAIARDTAFDFEKSRRKMEKFERKINQVDALLSAIRNIKVL